MSRQEQSNAQQKDLDSRVESLLKQTDNQKQAAKEVDETIIDSINIVEDLNDHMDGSILRVQNARQAVKKTSQPIKNFSKPGFTKDQYIAWGLSVILFFLIIFVWIYL